MNTPNDITIAHSVQKWLPLTENWIHRQVVCQKKYPTIVIANELSDSYLPFETIFVTSNVSKLARVANRIARKIVNEDIIRDNILARYNNVLIHSHFGPTGWLDLKCRRRKKQVTRFYGYDLNKLPNTVPIWQERYKALFDKCDAFITEGPFMKETLVQQGCSRDKIYIHQLGTDIDAIPFKNRIIDDRLNILIACRFTEKKGIIFALRGIATAYHDLGCKNMNITIIGDSTGSKEDEKYKSSMIDTIRKYKINNIVTLAGNKSYNELMCIALDHNIFLHPSVTASDGDCEGGYPVVLLDMMASGMPIISTHHCDIPSVITNDRLGILCAEKSGNEIALALAKIMNGDYRFRSNEIAEYVRSYFAWPRKAYDLVQIYEKIMK